MGRSWGLTAPIQREHVIDAAKDSRLTRPRLQERFLPRPYAPLSSFHLAGHHSPSLGDEQVRSANLTTLRGIADGPAEFLKGGDEFLVIAIPAVPQSHAALVSGVMG